MATQTITFGELSFSTAPLLISGPIDNRPVQYTPEVRYNNIEPSVNVTRTREHPGTSRPVKGALVEGVPLQVVSQTESSTLHAVKKRCDHLPQSRVSDEFLAGHEHIMSITHEREEIRLDREAIEAYLEDMSGPKKERLTQVLDDADFTLPGYNDKLVFAKSEVLVKGDGAQPRVVYQGTDMYNLIMGSVVYYLSRRIGEELGRSNPLNKGHEIIYCVGLTADQIADIIHHTPGQPVENDFKNNDGTQPAEVRKYEAMWYYKLGAPKWFVREFATNTSVRIFTRYGVKGKVNGQRWSGEVTTTTGNGYVNSCVSVSALRDVKYERATTLVYGDDNLTYYVPLEKLGDVSMDIKEGFEGVASSFGMKAEVVIPQNRESATFLRKRFVPSFTKTFPVPSFGRVLAKLPVRANYNAAIPDNDYMAGKLLSAAYEHRHIHRIREMLLQGAEQLSDNPYLDSRNQAFAHGFTAAQLKTKTSDALVVDHDCFDTFLHKVYGITYHDLVQEYGQIIDGILGFAVVNRGRDRRGPKHPPPLEPKLPKAVWSAAMEALVFVDVSV